MANFEFRPLTAAEQPRMTTLTNYAFAVNEPVESQSPALLEPDWTLGAFDGEELAACSGAFPFMLRLNGARMTAQGITAVSTSPRYRRQGLLREQMRRWMQAARDAEVALSVLWASMAAIYQRYGYGLGTVDVSYRFDARDIAFNTPFEDEGGCVALEPFDRVRSELDGLHRAFIAERNMILKRYPPMWDRLILTEAHPLRNPPQCGRRTAGRRALPHHLGWPDGARHSSGSADH